MASTSAAPRQVTAKGGAERWVGFASRLSLVLAVLMMISIAALVEFDRSPWSIALNFLRLSSLTLWFGATAFVPLVLGPSLAGVDRAYRVRINAGILDRFLSIANWCALVAVATTGITLVKNLSSLSDLWGTGYGIMSLLELLVLEIMAVIVWRSGLTSGFDLLSLEKSGSSIVRLVTSKTMRRAIDFSGANLVLGLVALLLSSLAGALYSPKESDLAALIPLSPGVSFDWLEALGYVVAAVVAVALIWYFGLVEDKVGNREGEKE